MSDPDRPPTTEVPILGPLIGDPIDANGVRIRWDAADQALETWMGPNRAEVEWRSPSERASDLRSHALTRDCPSPAPAPAPDPEPKE